MRELTREQALLALTTLDAKGRHVYARRVRVWLGLVLSWAVESAVIRAGGLTMETSPLTAALCQTHQRQPLAVGDGLPGDGAELMTPRKLRLWPLPWCGLRPTPKPSR